MFAYSLNNPTTLQDPSGTCPAPPNVDHKVENKIFCPCGCGGGGGGGLVVLAVDVLGSVCNVINSALSAVEAKVAAAVVAAGAVAHTAEKVLKKRLTQTYSVYFLQDENGVIKYVGRVTDSGYDARMRYHASTRGLTPKYRISGLSYAEARGLEEIGMMECHTLNALNPQNNQIHGISSINKNIDFYLEAACNYLWNRAEGTLLDILG
jgi:hypothetical protein